MRVRIVFLYSVVEMTFKDIDELADWLTESGREDFLYIVRLGN